jgi:hypothetical protein
METKEQLVTTVKEWIRIDSDIMKLKSELKERAAKKKSLTTELMTVMKKNEIDCFDIHGGSLIYKTNKVKKPLNSKMLMNTLKNYYKGDIKMAEELTKYVLDNRDENIKETIQRKLDK